MITSALVALGMAGYARIQRWSFYIGLAALAVMFVLMLDLEPGHLQGRLRPRGARRCSASRNAYQATIDQGAAEPGFAYAGASSTRSASVPGTLLLVPFMLFFLLYPNWGATLYGEVRGAGDFRKVLNGMLGGLWATVGLAIVFVLLAAKTFGWTFFNASNVTYVNYAYAVLPTTPPPCRSGAIPPLLASFLIDSHIVQAIIVLAFGAWWLGWTGHAVPVVDADDLRGGVRPRPARVGGARLRAAASRGRRSR